MKKPLFTFENFIITLIIITALLTTFGILQQCYEAHYGSEEVFGILVCTETYGKRQTFKGNVTTYGILDKTYMVETEDGARYEIQGKCTVTPLDVVKVRRLEPNEKVR